MNAPETAGVTMRLARAIIAEFETRAFGAGSPSLSTKTTKTI